MTHNEFGRLTRVALRSPRFAFVNAHRIERQWRALNFTAPPDFARALDEFDALTELVASGGAEIVEMPEAAGLTLDALYVRDASIVTPQGSVLCRMGKAARQHEPEAQRQVLHAVGVPVVGAIAPPGTLEGGDVVWFDDRTVAVSHGYRTNAEGIRQLKDLLGAEIEVVVVPLPHYRGPDDVFHLMSIVSPVDRDLAVVYSPLMPVSFRSWLRERGLKLVEVPDEEFESMGANVLALAPRRALMLAGNPVTRARLEATGVEVVTYEGFEISVKGGGGPTCLTRPLVRA
jgi:N-dimethylarginine dimethylaminohydrolase